MQDPRYFYITTPIYYVNDRPHIGHAYTSVACDVMARFKRLDLYHVKFLTGTDEHGQKVEKSAATAGVPPQVFVDQVSQHFRELTQLMHITNDDFIRTTEPRHKACAQALWQRMQEAGHIYLGSYAGWYAVRDEAYYAESELVNGKAPTGAEVEWVEEPSYFFKLSAFQDKLLEWYEKNPDCIGPASRRNEVISFVKGGLKDLSISRTTFRWGIPVPDYAKASSGRPGDNLSPEASAQGEKHIMYVWLDALANYLSALGFPDAASKEYAHFWPEAHHIIGKDILRFHAVYWPAFLMAANLPCPKRIFAHGWWTVEGEKMSKSLGNVVAPQELVDQYGVDATRWFLLREVPFGNDGNFSRSAVVLRANSELSNTIGNLAQRTLSMIQKNCSGVVPSTAAMTAEDQALIDTEAALSGIVNAMEDQRFHDAAQHILDMATRLNGYVDVQAPWTLKKTDPARMETVLYTLAEGVRRIAILLQPFCPIAAEKLLNQLDTPLNARDFTHLSGEYALKAGSPLNQPEPAFPRIEIPKEAAAGG